MKKIPIGGSLEEVVRRVLASNPENPLVKRVIGDRFRLKPTEKKGVTTVYDGWDGLLQTTVTMVTGKGTSWRGWFFAPDEEDSHVKKLLEENNLYREERHTTIGARWALEVWRTHKGNADFLYVSDRVTREDLKKINALATGFGVELPDRFKIQ